MAEVFPGQAADTGGLRRAVARPGCVVWMTGLSGSGKSTIAAELAPVLAARTGRVVEMLDGDVVRTHLSQGLSFSREDRETNVRRIGWVADLVARHGGVAIVAAISPFRAGREEIKRAYTNVVEVYVEASVEECARRDTKGLYARAMRGEIANFTGVNDPYDPPENADVVVSTAGLSVGECVGRIVGALEGRGLL